MPARRQALFAAFLVAAFFLMLGLALVASGDWRNALLNAAGSAGEAATGPGLVDSLTEHMIPDRKPAAGSSLPQLAAPAPAPGGMVPPAAPPPCAVPPCPGEPSPDAMEAAAAEAVEEARRKLQRVGMKDVDQGERRMYGQGEEPSQTSAATTIAAPRGAPDTAALEASFGGFIQKLKADAAKNAPPGGPSLGGGHGGSGGDGPDGGESPILHNGRIDSKLDSPTLRALQRVNAQTGHSVGMSRDPGLQDGSRDKAGKGFDGNQNTFGEIPIIETKGAMGQKQIIIDQGDGSSH